MSSKRLQVFLSTVAVFVAFFFMAYFFKTQQQMPVYVAIGTTAAVVVLAMLVSFKDR
ncbi:MAG: hypothetical protein KGI33_04875 [Thaumarchaeota archaeon]|nr:hypothetical protein [Nitrososphaerota archaeon]